MKKGRNKKKEDRTKSTTKMFSLKGLMKKKKKEKQP